MLILQQPAQAETRVKNSRFLAEMFTVNSPDEAKDAWKFRKETYVNGGHIVYAFTVGASQNISGCSDDGEPSGTAGRPVLAVLLGSGVTNAMITVARWFGGTKLGTGGLVHAYGGAAKEAVENAEFEEFFPQSRAEFAVPYQRYAECRIFLEGLEFRVEKEDFSSDVAICGTLRSSRTSELLHYLQELGNGKIPCRISDC
jgi:uncharacterized YigZ family protein